MSLGGLVNRGLIKPTVGCITNKFKGKSRRHTYFFEDIFAEYVKSCEKEGYNGELRGLGREWTNMVLRLHIPNTLTKLPNIAFFNYILRTLWVNTGVMDDIKATKKGDIIFIETRNEGPTRYAGENGITVGMYAGILEVLYKCKNIVVESHQSKDACRYTYRLVDEDPVWPETKNRVEYLTLNQVPLVRGHSLNDAQRTGLFTTEGHRLYFRGTSIGPMDNTIYHLFGREGILFDDIPEISRTYFGPLIEKGTPKRKGISLLKTLLQTMGWGITTFVLEPGEIRLEIKYPPYGTQAAGDNWDFLAQVVLGYLQLWESSLRISTIRESNKRLSIIYSN